MRAGVSVALALALIPGWGCGSSKDAPYTAPTIPVKGTVTYRGKPLTRGTVTFESVDNGKEANGEIKPDGSYELTSFKTGDGAVAGEHRVSISDTDKKQGVPIKYRSLGSSKIVIDVSADKTDYPIDLK